MNKYLIPMLKIALILSLSFISVFTSHSQVIQYIPETDTAFVPVYQPEKRFAIGISSGVAGIVVRDQVISNFLYKGTAVPLIFEFESRNQYTKSSFTMGFMNNPQLKTETNKGFAYKGDYGEFFPSEKDGLDFSTLKTKMSYFNYTTLFLLKKTERSKIKTYLGMNFELQSFRKKFLQFEYINQLNERVISTAFVVNFERNFNSKHSLEYNFGLPVLAHVNRSLYNPESEPTTISESKFSLFSKIFGFDSRFTYRIQASSRISLRASYAFRYLQISFPKKEQWAYNQATVGLYFHF
jgi:hypothetical protein